MADNKALSTPAVIVNNATIAIVPGSLKYDKGEGEITVRSESTGGGAVSSVHSEDASTKIGKVSFDVYLKTKTDGKISDWKSRVGSNSIEFVQRVTGGEPVAVSFNNHSCVNAVERNASPDGVTSIEFEGDPAA